MSTRAFRFEILVVLILCVTALAVSMLGIPGHGLLLSAGLLASLSIFCRIDVASMASRYNRRQSDLSRERG